jgi:outer membrane protein assembly factor BamB
MDWPVNACKNGGPGLLGIVNDASAGSRRQAAELTQDARGSQAGNAKKNQAAIILAQFPTWPREDVVSRPPLAIISNAPTDPTAIQDTPTMKDTTMARFCVGLLAVALLTTAYAAWAPAGYCQQVNDGQIVAAADWPWWRGPHRNGVASDQQKPPTVWSEAEGVVWSSPVPGRGHGSPTVAGDHIYLATADEQQDIQSVLCYHRQTGELLWHTEVHRGGAMRKNAKSSAASSSPACDGERVFISFPNSGAVYTTALSLDGQQLWQTKITDYVIHQGYGSSPAIYQSLLIVSADNKGGGAVAGLDRNTGQIQWKRPRPMTPNYASPIIQNIYGRDQLLLTGCDLFSSFDPLNGETLWEIPAATTECVTSTVTDGKHVFSSGGYPRNHLSAVLADGSGKIVWETEDRVYVPSLLVRDGYLYGVMDAGIAACWKCDTGEEVWKARLAGNFSASPVLVGDTIYATNEVGQTFIYSARPDKFNQLAVNRLGNEVFATPTICGGRIYMRVARNVDGQRQEFLYCLGTETTQLP